MSNDKISIIRDSECKWSIKFRFWIYLIILHALTWQIYYCMHIYWEDLNTEVLCDLFPSVSFLIILLKYFRWIILLFIVL